MRVTVSMGDGCVQVRVKRGKVGLGLKGDAGERECVCVQVREKRGEGVYG